MSFECMMKSSRCFRVWLFRNAASMNWNEANHWIASRWGEWMGDMDGPVA
jgi:hypothetical protein